MTRRHLLALAACLFLVPAGLPAEAPAVQKPYFDSNGVKIHYIVQGKEDGEPVLLIHGFTTNIEGQWAPVIKALSKDYKVIAFDCRGHGGSEKPHDEKKYGAEMVKDAVRLLDHLKIDKAHVAGYSMGGDLALQMVIHYPERVRTATLGGKGLPRPGRERFYKELADSLDQGKGFGPLIVALTPKGQPVPSAAQVKAINAMLLLRNDPKALAAVVRSGFNGKDRAITDEQVKAIKVPIQALIGDRDPLKSEVDELKKRLPELKVVVIKGADHITAFTRPEFIHGLKGFLDAHRAAGK